VAFELVITVKKYIDDGEDHPESFKYVVVWPGRNNKFKWSY